MGKEMRFIDTSLPGVFSIELKPFVDERGFLTRLFCQQELAEIGFDGRIVQISHSSTSEKGTIRGLHYQHPPACEIKIVRCLRGAVFDVIVDLREDSPTFLQWQSFELSPASMNQIYIPWGCAHGFQTLADDTELIYLISAPYNPQHAGTVRYDDPALAISWPLPVTFVSSKDKDCSHIDNHFKGIKI